MSSRMLNGNRVFIAALALLIGAPIVQAQSAAFTYQGRLTDGGTPATGNYDMQFKLFDTADVGTGTQQGPTVALPAVQVANGAFSVELDFTAAVFDGSPLFLEVGVKAAGSPNPHTILSPRQPLTSAPYAVRSMTAATADGLSVACVNCVTSSQIGSVNAGVLTGTVPVASVPAGSAHYIQNTTGQQASSNFNISGSGVIGGTLGIGIPVPSYKLDVGGTLRAIRDTSNDIVVQTTGGTNAWSRFWMLTPSQAWTLGTSENFNGNQLYLFDATFNQTRMTIQPNAGEVSFPSPSSNHIVVQTSGGTNSWAQLRMRTTNQEWAMGTSQNFIGDQFYLFDATRNQTRMTIQPNGGAITFPLGNVRVNVLEVAGSDVAEHFEIIEGAKPGMLVAIDPHNAGKLSIARSAYNRRVAGVISGANNLRAGMILRNVEGTKNTIPVALSGRVWVYCEARRQAIKPGDLLTSSATPGHAMKVTNHAKAQGAIIGKAMTGLKSGRGLVLVLVTLQ